MNLRQAIGRSKRNEDADVNITPVMNIFVILIPFLLLTATFVRIAIIDFSLPSMEQGGSSGVSEQVENLTVLVISINKNGFEIKTSERNYPSIQIADGKYDYQALTEVLSEIKRQYSRLEDVVISPTSEIHYQVIIKVLDHCREVGFPNFSISG